MPTTRSSILALDVGEVRIGVAISSQEARLPRPFATLRNDENFTAKLQQIIDDEGVATVVVGLPRGLDGQETAQTRYAVQFANGLKDNGIDAHFQDEAVTSAKAEEELQLRGKAYTKEDIDALSATYILEDYLQGGNV